MTPSFYCARLWPNRSRISAKVGSGGAGRAEKNLIQANDAAAKPTQYSWLIWLAWKPPGLQWPNQDRREEATMLKMLSAIIEIVKILSEDFSFVRVDSCEIKASPRFGELAYIPVRVSSVLIRRTGM
jgi:hypothetical protein